MLRRLAQRKQIREELTAWMFLSSALFLLLAFLITPFVMAFILSFTNQRLISPLPTGFVGIRNYVRFFIDEDFWQALRNTFFFAAVVVPVQSALALLLAVLINCRLPAINFYFPWP